MRVWGVAILALFLAGRAAAQVAEIPEAHMLLVDRSALKPADAARDGARFEAAEKAIYHEIMAHHGANLILDASTAPIRWSGLDVTAEAEAALHVAIPEWSPPSGTPASTTPAKASNVRMLFVEIAPSDQSDPKFHDTLEQIAAGQDATLVVDKRAVVLGAPAFDVTRLVRSTLESYRSSGTLPLVVGGPDVPMARVAIIDRAALIRGSSAGRDIGSQARRLAAKAQSEFHDEADAIRREAARLQAQIRSLSPNDWQKRLQDYDSHQSAFSKKVGARNAAINAAIFAAQKKIETVAGPIVLKIVGDDHANMIVDRMAVVASDDALDITTPAIAALNAALPRVEVTLQPPQK